MVELPSILHVHPEQVVAVEGVDPVEKGLRIRTGHRPILSLGVNIHGPSSVL